MQDAVKKSGETAIEGQPPDNGHDDGHEKRTKLTLVQNGTPIVDAEVFDDPSLFRGEDGRIYRDFLEAHRQYVYKKCGVWLW